ncbi:hypothetical protein AB0B45_49880 [Nonomuraea sp. NPDC049152]|uniref:hypothetical protein n=1 Tax=Nonomuraea sp. NPDC049152 TaxID=3154350 RepID=UPI0033E5DE53
MLQHEGKPAYSFTLTCWEGMAYMIVPEPRYLPALARSAHTVAAGGDSMPPEPPLDEAYFARMLDGIARRGYMPASPRPSR